MRPAAAGLVLAVLTALPAGWAAAGTGDVAATPAGSEGVALAPRFVLADTPPGNYVPPGASFEGAPSSESQSITEKWWFWTAVGVVLVATVTVILVAGRAPSAPGSTLGNMEAFGGR